MEIQTQRPVALELYKDYKELGRFMLRYVGSTIAAGVVTEVINRTTPPIGYTMCSSAFFYIALRKCKQTFILLILLILVL